MSIETPGNDPQRYSIAEERVGSASTPDYTNVADGGGTASARGAVPPSGAAYGSGNSASYGAGPIPGAPVPALAGLLGFIPGVGAMYNGQFAKGIAHIAIFAVFCSLSKNVNGVFGLFIAGWEIYMVFEAYQTAIARRDGVPLPDPFGLNNIGERFGLRANPNFNSFWAHGAPPPAGDQPPAAGPYTRTGYGAPAPFQVDPAGNVYRADAAPAAGFPVQGAEYVAPAGYPTYPSPYPAAGYPGPSYGSNPGLGAMPYGAPPPMPVPPVPPASGAGLPVGALWLIGLGFFALLGSIRAFDFLEGESTGGIFLIGLSFFLLWRRWSASSTLYAPGSPAARWSLVQSSKGAGILFVVGLLTLLQGLRVVYWENSWPFLLIAIGVLLLVERVAFNRIAGAAAAPYSTAQQPVQPTHDTSTSILPRYTRGDDSTGTEGR